MWTSVSGVRHVAGTPERAGPLVRTRLSGAPVSISANPRTYPSEHIYMCAAARSRDDTGTHGFGFVAVRVEQPAIRPIRRKNIFYDPDRAVPGAASLGV